MAGPTLNTSVSRRAMLAGGGAAVAISAIAVLPAAAGPARDFNVDPNLDARLFRRIAVAERLRKEHARACRLLDRLRVALRNRPGDPDMPWMSLYARRWDAAERTGRRADLLRTRDLFHRYAAAVRGAVATPAHSLPGIHAKLRLAVIAARRGDARIYLYEDREWLEAVLADLKRLIGHARRGG